MWGPAITLSTVRAKRRWALRYPPQTAPGNHDDQSPASISERRIGGRLPRLHRPQMADCHLDKCGQGGRRRRSSHQPCPRRDLLESDRWCLKQFSGTFFLSWSRSTATGLCGRWTISPAQPKELRLRSRSRCCAALDSSIARQTASFSPRLPLSTASSYSVMSSRTSPHAAWSG